MSIVGHGNRVLFPGMKVTLFEKKFLLRMSVTTM
jgi:hypothetical protein